MSNSIESYISICMIKLCSGSIYKPLEMIFKSCLNQGTGVQQNIWKTFITLCLIIFLDDNRISSNQSGFKPGNSCINQLIAITHDIFKSFYDGLERGGVFLDISESFDKV